MAKKISLFNNADIGIINGYNDKCIKHEISTKLEFTINIAGTDFNDVGEAINFAYRCGLAAMNSPQFKKFKDGDGPVDVDQDELYKILKTSHSLEHKSDFLREIAKEWFPIEPNSEKKIKTVNLELNELADYLKK